jgi:DNA-binding transcriptional regulator YhcF (GntR family)
MEREQLIYSQRGTGYFIMDNETITVKVRKEMVSRTISVFLEEMRAMNFSDNQIMSELESQIKELKKTGGVYDDAVNG